MWLDHKRHSKKEGWYILYGERYRNIVGITNGHLLICELMI